MPNWHRIWTLLKLGAPIGFSYLIEVTSFTFMSLFIAHLGTTALAGHQIVANMGTVIYMVPLSLSIATMTLVSNRLVPINLSALKRSAGLLCFLQPCFVLRSALLSGSSECNY